MKKIKDALIDWVHEDPGIKLVLIIIAAIFIYMVKNNIIPTPDRILPLK